MLFFNTYRFDKKHIDMIKNDRKIIVKNKLITYGDTQQHLINFEKHMRVNREHDEIMEDIDNNILPIFDYIKIDNDGDEIIYKANYIWDNLLPTTKKYLRTNDKKFSIFDYSHFDSVVNNTSSYDFREKRFLKLYGDIELTDSDRFNDLYERYVVIGNTMPLPLANKAYTSARRAYKTVKQLALANSKDFKYFCTFTFADIENNDKYLECDKNRLEGEKSIKFRFANGDADIKIKAFTDFMHVFKRKIKKKYGIDLKYITVPEEHKSGDIHFHSLMSDFPIDELSFLNPYWLDYDFRKKRRFNGKGFNDWKYGKSDIQPILDSEKVSTYIAKYMLKNFSEVSEKHYDKYLNKKRYYPSMNLIKPIEKYLDDDEYEIEFSHVGDTTYREEYYNPYNDSNITKYIFSNN